MVPVDFQCCNAAILMWISVECYDNCAVIKKKKKDCINAFHWTISRNAQVFVLFACVILTLFYVHRVDLAGFVSSSLKIVLKFGYIFTYGSYLEIFYNGVNHVKSCKQFSCSLVLSCLIFLCLWRHLWMQDRVSFDVEVVWEFIVLIILMWISWGSDHKCALNQTNGICDPVANFYMMKLEVLATGSFLWMWIISVQCRCYIKEIQKTGLLHHNT